MLLSMCLGRSTSRIGGKVSHLDSIFDSFGWAPFSLDGPFYTYVLAKILQKGATFIQN